MRKKGSMYEEARIIGYSSRCINMRTFRYRDEEFGIENIPSGFKKKLW